MSNPRPPQRSDGSISWIEVFLIVILVVLVLAILLELFGPFLRAELTNLCNQYDLACNFLR